MANDYGYFVNEIFKLTQIDLSSYKENQMKRRIDAFIMRHNSKGYDDFIASIKKDRQLLEENGVTTRIYVSPAAVLSSDNPYLEYDGRLTFLGANSHVPNQEGVKWLLDEVVPLLKSDSVPRLDLIGKGWNNMRHDGKIEIRTTGYVDDLAQALRGSVMLVPILSGSGMRMKILEAAANSVPFITTSVGVEGLDFRDGDSCIIADTPLAFAQAIDRLTGDRALCRRHTKKIWQCQGKILDRKGKTCIMMLCQGQKPDRRAS